MSDHQPRIIAKNAKRFNELLEAVKTLPEVIFERIDSVEDSLVGITCTLASGYNTTQSYYLPKETETIKDYGDYIGIHTKKFFFKIPKRESNKVFDYYILKQ